MLLLIDAGNTRIKWATVRATADVARLGVWVQHGSASHQEIVQLQAQWAAFPLQRVVISNVAGPALRQQLAAALPGQIPVDWFAARDSLAGITNHYQNPAQLGSDRFLSAIAAHALFPAQDLIVATCGTATTIDAVSAQGDFIGGLIVPGLQVMTRSLALNTAQLPHVQDRTGLVSHFATHTEAAILSGCLAAQVGAIEHAVQHLALFTGSANSAAPLCILSGGAAGYLLPSLRIAHKLVDNLVLIGLQASALC